MSEPILDGISKWFSFGEVQNFIFDLGFDWEDFGNNKPSVIDSLVRYYKKQPEIDRQSFMVKLNRLRPHVDWSEYHW